MREISVDVPSTRCLYKLDTMYLMTAHDTVIALNVSLKLTFAKKAIDPKVKCVGP